MTWTSTIPVSPGRYWWRSVDRYGRPECGLVLLSWTPPSYSKYGGGEPRLTVNTHVSFCSSFGGEQEYQGWSTGGSGSDFMRHYPRSEFWSEPERGPEGFLPELPPKPPWTPPTPEKLEAKRKKIDADRKKADRDAAKEAAMRTKRIAEARAAGRTLYECEKCDALLDKGALVQVRECPHCSEERFDGTENGQNCPSCNRRFTSNYTEHGCPECLEECEPLSTEAEPVVSAPKKAKR